MLFHQYVLATNPDISLLGLDRQYFYDIELGMKQQTQDYHFSDDTKLGIKQPMQKVLFLFEVMQDLQTKLIM